MARLPFLLIALWAILITAALVTGYASAGWDFLADAGARAPVLLLLLYVCLHLLVKAVKNWLRYREYSELR